MQYSDRDGAKRDWTTLCDSLRSYLLDVYPTANIRVDEGRLLDAGDAEYDMASSDEGRKRLWQEACKRQSKLKNGKDKYDLILAFVSYHQEDGTRRGYTFGRPANIITYTDTDMLTEVAHEIAHCYQAGDEFVGGSLSNLVNLAPSGVEGRDFVKANQRRKRSRRGLL